MSAAAQPTYVASPTVVSQPVVVTTPTYVTAPTVVSSPAVVTVPGTRVWVEGHYVEQAQANGTVVRTWCPGYYR